MNIEHEYEIEAAPGEFFSPGYLVSIGRDGLAYRTVVHHEAPWWAKWFLLRWWQARQPQILGFAAKSAAPGEKVILAVKGSMTWPDYPRGK